MSSLIEVESIIRKSMAEIIGEGIIDYSDKALKAHFSDLTTACVAILGDEHANAEEKAKANQKLFAIGMAEQKLRQGLG